MDRSLFKLGIIASLLALASVACAPRVEVAVDKPITVNLNVKIDHEIRVRVDKQLDDIFSDDSGLF
ncbi:YnbE family lipoprotein [Alginatibacterium sediminis]|uniref:YnbE family lipoprotein n=1 Tax=Alginatibacterium sediminis TaxID=2164068 RepID=A0A420EN91_9ALTE|nr:YnbE family lipoprotein [Alginatibacterium sediminis]RKF22187.1 YnbE family lipoprotein [Alginatibacterium sediminis]